MPFGSWLDGPSRPRSSNAANAASTSDRTLWEAGSCVGVVSSSSDRIRLRKRSLSCFMNWAWFQSGIVPISSLSVPPYHGCWKAGERGVPVGAIRSRSALGWPGCRRTGSGGLQLVVAAQPHSPLALVCGCGRQAHRCRGRWPATRRGRSGGGTGPNLGPASCAGGTGGRTGGLETSGSSTCLARRRGLWTENRSSDCVQTTSPPRLQERKRTRNQPGVRRSCLARASTDPVGVCSPDWGKDWPSDHCGGGTLWSVYASTTSSPATEEDERRSDVDRD